jgi:DNA invertase Pin-like site-specific DNA recombinase
MKAVIYCRTATKEQTSTNCPLSLQEKECRKFARSNGYKVGRVFSEYGASGSTLKRKELQKLIKYATENKKKISAIFLWDYARLSRNFSDLLELVKIFNSLGLKILSVSERKRRKANGRLMINIRGILAQYESDLRSERIKEGLRRKKSMVVNA